MQDHHEAIKRIVADADAKLTQHISLARSVAALALVLVAFYYALTGHLWWAGGLWLVSVWLSGLAIGKRKTG